MIVTYNMVDRSGMTDQIFIYMQSQADHVIHKLPTTNSTLQ